jgi:hypothetical protein
VVGEIQNQTLKVGQVADCIRQPSLQFPTLKAKVRVVFRPIRQINEFFFPGII